MTLEIKLIIAAILAALVGYSYLWTYHQGQLTGAANEVKVQRQVQVENQLEFNKQRERELRDARAAFEKQLKNETKKVKALEDANKILNTQNSSLQAALNQPVPDDYIGVLNSQRSGFGQSESGSDKPTGGSDEKVLTPSSFTDGWVSPVA